MSGRRDKPWEGSGMPDLYHLYAGHDTNRDWFMLNLKETQLLTRLLYKEWFPTILYDVHQMGNRGRSACSSRRFMIRSIPTSSPGCSRKSS